MANLSTKELSALEDQIGQEETLIKMYEAMSCMCNDKKVQNELSNYASRHKQHYNTLVSFLQ